jgi:signal transduction histidine kinase
VTPDDPVSAYSERMGRARGWVERHGGRLGVLLLVVGSLVPLVDALLGGTFVGNPVDTLLVAAAGSLVGARLRPVAAVSCCASAAGLLTVANQVADRGQYSAVNDLFFFAALVGGPALAGAVVEARARQVRELRRLSRLHAQQREAELRAVRLGERNRVERAVTQSMVQRMSGMVVQVSGARSGAGSPEVGQALRRLEDTARGALDDLRETLGSLRTPTEDLTGWDPAAVGPVAPARVGPLDVLVACCGVPVAFEAVASAQAQGPVTANLVAGLALGAPLLVRRARPVAAVAVCFVVATAMTAWLTPLPVTVSMLLPLSLVAFALGAHTRGRRRLAGLGVLLLGGLAVTFATPPADRDQGGILPTSVWVLVAYVAGVAAAEHTDRAARLRALLDATETGRAAQLRLAVAEQRQVIARDLHDTVAHAMTVVCLHAEAARRPQVGTLDVDRSLEVIESTTREAMLHLRQGLRSLEIGNDLVEELLGVADSLGVDVDVRLAGVPRSLDGDDALVARRVVREALVNAARHAPGTPVRVQICAEPDGLVVEVSNGRAAERGRLSDVGSGTGLLGLGELVRAHGGRLEHGALGDRFRVAAHLPSRPGVPA